ncbi:hypothetical protein DFO67_11083 [Modicisalibacter xianhensis]|uniref:Uncharacterized protein n=1 Tax=Modicisalibacter xianhensis TaxID=442341 RepID=A0A4R8FXU0_9GAMM|nr:hypothetical protein [Halomonas xianhensis]TDX28383.1 hypothetical protein DFO67_11083 [Halomonas xianhensis]
MPNRAMKTSDVAKAIGIGIGIALLLSAVMVPASKMGLSPMPKPLGLAFAQTLLGKVPLPIGLLFHVVYVTSVAAFYLLFIEWRPGFAKALAYRLLLWVLVLVLFFPAVGWGFFGLGESPKLIVASLIPHFLFTVFLWLIPKWVFGDGSKSDL